MKEKYRLVIVSHTHWDREWYLPFQQFRMKLVKMIDKLLDVLKTNPEFKCFTLDGQTIILEDYLEIRPEKKEELRKRIEEGRIIVGPWYVQPDEFLVSGESIIRNLMLGHKIANKFGKVMKVGYVPDSFGHISQMPQILQGFEINSFIFTRGLGDEGETLKSEFNWQAPDGTSVLAIHQRRGYGNAAHLSKDPQKALERIKEEVKSLGPYASTHNILLNNGGDHREPLSYLPEVIKYINTHLKNVKLIQGSFIDYLNYVKSERSDFSSFKGELRSAKYVYLLNGVYSSRIYLKQANEKVQTLLEKWAEPSSTFAWILGKPFPRGFLSQAYKYLLQNHAHDSICGCSIDQVHQDMMRRFTWSEQIANNIVEESLEFLIQNIGTFSSENKENSQVIVVFNPLAGPRTDAVQTKVEVVGLKTEELILKNSSGQIIPYQVLGVKENPPLTYEITKEELGMIERMAMKGVQTLEIIRNPKSPSVLEIKATTVKQARLRPEIQAKVEEIKRFVQDKGIKTIRLRIYPAPEAEILFLAENIPSFGYETYFLSPSEKKESKNDSLKIEKRAIENEYYRVEVNSNGTLRIIDKKTGQLYEGLNLFEDTEDSGDEYDYSPIAQSQTITSSKSKAKISLVEKGPVRATLKIEIEMKLPASLFEGRKKRSDTIVKCPLASYVSLYPRVKRIDIRTVFDNRAEDHRLRVLFPTSIKASHSYAEGQFMVVKRPLVVKKVKNWAQQPPLTHPQQAWVDINDGQQGLTLVNKGLPEYQAKKDARGTTLALTLLRCVGWLSRGDLLTRRSNAGPSIPTPQAQCQGEHVFQYALVPHMGTWIQAKTYQEAHRHNVPLRAKTTDIHKGKLPLKMSFLSIEPDNLVITAIKKAESRNALIVRFYNITEETVQGKVSLCKETS